MQQEVVLAMLAKEPSQGYQLRARLDQALGPLGEGINAGQIYVTLGRLEKAGFVAREGAATEEADRKAYVLTSAGQERVTEWLNEVSWPRPDLAEFHLKLVAAAQAGLGRPDRDRRRAAARAAPAAERGATRRHGRAQWLRRRALARRDRPPPAGRPALAGGV